MLQASGTFFLVFFCCLSARTQGFESNTNIVLSDSVQVYNNLSKQYLEQEPEKALNFSKKALEAARRLNFKPGIADAMANLGQFYLDQGNARLAFENLESYQQICEEMQDSLRLADAYFHLGTWCRQQHKMQEALQYYQSTVALAERQENWGLVRKCFNHIGGVYYYNKEFAEANRFFFRSLEHLSSSDNPEYAAILNNIGVVYKADKKFRKSLSYFKQSLEILQTLQKVRDMSVVMMNIGEIYQLYNDYDLAEKHYHLALEAARQANSMKHIAESYEYLTKLHAEKENFRKAYQYQSLFTSYKDTLARMEKHKSVEEINNALEAERDEKLFSQFFKDKELELLSQEYKTSKLQLNQKNSLIYMIASLSLILSMIALVFYQRDQLKKRQNEQLEADNQHNFRHNQQLQEMNEKLKSSEQELKSLNDTKDKFFSIISHDLRSPLYTLAGFIQVMKNDIHSFSADELNRFTGKMERSLQGVTALLDNLFCWATQQNGLIEFAPVEFQLQKIVEESIELLQATADLKNIELSHQVGDFRMEADIQMIRLILRNLLANAIKFTGSGGEVVIKGFALPDEVQIVVQDNGIGISEENQQKLFGTKGILTQRGTANEKGSGLGLLLCKEFTEMHKGRISVESVPGKGTKFNIYLPHEQPS